jgi:hypothetical protein
MREPALSPDEYEEDANRIRARLGATLAQLRTNLVPSNLIDEVARESGVREMSLAGAFDFSVRRHPLPTALIGLGIGLWAIALSRSSDAHKGKSSLRETVRSIARSATGVFRERAEAKRLAFASVASSHIQAGATQLSDAVEKSVHDLIGGTPGTPATRPLIESAVQMALFAALEGLLSRSRK